MMGGLFGKEESGWSVVADDKQASSDNKAAGGAAAVAGASADADADADVRAELLEDPGRGYPMRPGLPHCTDCAALSTPF